MGHQNASTTLDIYTDVMSHTVKNEIFKAFSEGGILYIKPILQLRIIYIM